MKKVILLFALTAFYFSTNAQNMKDLSRRINEMEDRIAIKNLVDTFSILADQKDIKSQVLLFTENATVKSISNGTLSNTLNGRKGIGDAFERFLNNFETVYHINGQLVLVLDGQKASGTHYCLVTLIGIENGKKIRTDMGVHYNDEYVKQDGRWLIAKRVSTFAWRDKRELGE